ncbi:class F sortase [Curtobacterium sp. A7_M15]|uniref:class F sortase n=1 Tax=Curtobacterium sp. A7_M15 TaxID=3065241 RepID=UPI002737E617|nr:class F sortase [Curtobacterium sp. A7_M15]MDP4334838.1 class F sortase [Curtobacterium sp. A7_M15]
MQVRPAGRPSTLLLVIAAVTAVTMLALGISGVVTATSSVPPGTVRDMHGDPVRLEAPVVTAPQARATPDGSGRLVVPSVRLDVPLGALDAVNGRITPPGFRSAYLVRDVGVVPERAASGTVVVVMHSLRGGGTAPGNFLTDVDRGRSRVAIGAVARVAGVAYTVTGSTLVDKDRIADDAGVWGDVPDRLLLITCLERPDGSPSTQNLVITATRA